MMTILYLGALLTGFVSALALSFIPFACGVGVALVIGSVSTVVQGSALASAVLIAVVLLVVSQVGYGFGVLAGAFIPEAPTLVRRFRTAKTADLSDPSIHAKTKAAPSGRS